MRLSSKIVPLMSHDVRISTWMVGSTERTSRQTLIPLPSGSRVEDGDVGFQRRDPALRLEG